jgi:hypothetical protein
MTELVCRYLGALGFAVFSAYGLIGTLRVVRAPTAAPGPRPWALFAVFELLEAVQIYGLFAAPAGRSAADIRGGAVAAVAVLCFCAYLQSLTLSAVGARAPFPRRPFYLGLAILLVIVFAARLGGASLP